MEVESSFSEFEMSNPVRSSTVVNQFDSAAQRAVKQSFADTEVCSNGSSVANVIRGRQLLAKIRADASKQTLPSVFGETGEVSRNPSSKSTLPMTESSGSVSPVQQTAVEARRKLENMMNEVRSQSKNQFTVLALLSLSQRKPVPTQVEVTWLVKLHRE